MQAGVFQNDAARFKDSQWYKLDQETRMACRNMFMTALGSTENKDLNAIPYLKDLCMCIAVIGTMEIPTGEWPEYVDCMSV
jgi:hypothetical protein